MDDAEVVQHRYGTARHRCSWMRRASAAGSGRDTALFDEVRAFAREQGSGASFDMGMWRRGRELKSQRDPMYVRDVSFHVAPPELVSQGIAALSSAVPEVAVPSAMRDDEVPDLSGSRWGIRALAVIGIDAWFAGAQSLQTAADELAASRTASSSSRSARNFLVDDLLTSAVGIDPLRRRPF
jgi:hypothetical protein